MDGTGGFDKGTLRASHNNGSTLNEDPYQTHGPANNHHQTSSSQGELHQIQ
jgi:hypothetical protein